jgi:hypothetical protein
VWLAFLEWDKERRIPTTQDKCKCRKLSFAASIPRGLTVCELKNSHVNRWIEKVTKARAPITGVTQSEQSTVWSIGWPTASNTSADRPIKSVKQPAYCFAVIPKNELRFR